MATATLRSAMAEILPSADSTNNTQMSDVIGNKSDTSSGTSVVARLKDVQTRSLEIMTSIDKIVGINGCELIVGSDEFSMPAGYACYAIIVNIDDTEIATLDWLVDDEAVEKADASWEGEALKRGDYISFANPVVAITLTNAGDSVFAYLQQTTWVAPE